MSGLRPEDWVEHNELTLLPALLVVVVNSAFEELFAAAYVVRALERYGISLAVVVSGVLRALYHLYQGPAGGLAALGWGLLYAAAFARWRTAWPLVVAHALHNATVFGWDSFEGRG